MGTEIVHGYCDFRNLKPSFLILRGGWPPSVFNLISPQGATFLWWCLFQGSVCSCKLQFLSLFEVLNMVPEQGKLVRSLVLQKHVLDGLFGQCAGSWRGGGQSYWVWTWVLCQRLLWDIVGPLSISKGCWRKGGEGRESMERVKQPLFPSKVLSVEAVGYNNPFQAGKS